MGNILSKIIVVGLANVSIATKHAESSPVSRPLASRRQGEAINYHLREFWRKQQRGTHLGEKLEETLPTSDEDTFYPSSGTEEQRMAYVQGFLEEARHALLKATDSQEVRITISQNLDDPSRWNVITTIDSVPPKEDYRKIQPNDAFFLQYSQGLKKGWGFQSVQHKDSSVFLRFGWWRESRPLTTGGREMETTRECDDRLDLWREKRMRRGVMSDEKTPREEEALRRACLRNLREDDNQEVSIMDASNEGLDEALQLLDFKLHSSPSGGSSPVSTDGYSASEEQLEQRVTALSHPRTGYSLLLPTIHVEDFLGEAQDAVKTTTSRQEICIKMYPDPLIEGFWRVDTTIDGNFKAIYSFQRKTDFENDYIGGLAELEFNQVYDKETDTWLFSRYGEIEVMIEICEY